jgi:hypothetical protein
MFTAAAGLGALLPTAAVASAHQSQRHSQPRRQRPAVPVHAGCRAGQTPGTLAAISRYPMMSSGRLYAVGDGAGLGGRITPITAATQGAQDAAVNYDLPI